MEFQKHQPTLFVGLGGAGGSVVNRIASILHRREDWTNLQHVIQFFALDTDKADLDGLNLVPQGHRFVISGFDKGTWVREKLGRLSLSSNKEDLRVSQWVHDWYNFRQSQGAGAGQIRVESRVSLYNCMETTDLIKRVENAILATISKDNNFVAHEVKKFNVFIYFTVAGGTGSGAHLMLAAFLRHLIANFGWSANITAVAMQSTLITPYIRNMRQREDILANGYSAMKEVEHLMRLKVFSDSRDPNNRRDFVYHPFMAKKEITESPFDFVYVLDTNPDVYIKNFKTTAADAIYLQLFSPIFAKRNSDFDNYEKNQKRLARSKYSTFYGSYGCSVLTLADRDLLKYCTNCKTADTIKEYLSTGLEVTTSAGTKSFVPLQKELEACDEKDQGKLWDEAFIKYISAILTEEGGSDTEPEALKELGKQLRKRGFKYSLNLNALTKKDTIDTPGQDDNSDDFEDLLPIVSDVDDAADDEDGEGLETGNQWSANQMLGDLDDAFLKSDHGKGVSEVLHLLKSKEGSYEAKISFNPGMEYGEFCEYLRKKLHVEVISSIDQALEQESLQVIERNTQFGTAERLLKEYANAFKQSLKTANQTIDNTDERFKQLFGVNRLANWFTERKTPIDQLRLAVLSYHKVSERYVDFLNDCIKKPELKITQAFGGIEQKYGELLETRKFTLSDAKAVITERTVNADYISCHRDLGRRVKGNADRCGAVLMTHYMLAVQKHLVKVFGELNEILREFSGKAKLEISKIEQAAKDYLQNPDGQSEDFYNDIEALQSFDGERIWDEYYNSFVKQEVQMKAKSVYAAIGAVLANEELPSVADKLDQLKDILAKDVEQRLKPVIVGEYTTGKEKRGLTLQKALVREAQLKFKGWLIAKGRWEDERENWEKVVQSSSPEKLRSRGRKDLYEEIQAFSRNYLETKVSACMRRSAIMANVNMDEKEVTEYSCRQYMFCYDISLYNEPEADSTTLDFPSIVHRINPEFDMHDYTDNSKMVIFYQAILGVPLFVFKNLIGEMKTAYSKRVPERNWSDPAKGERQYPLHIDKNWEQGDPGADSTKIPQSLDPDEACLTSSNMDVQRAEFFECWYSLNKAGLIMRDEDGFFVPAGKLGNDTDVDVRLGLTIRETVQQMLIAQSAHEEIRKETEKLGKPDIEEIDDKIKKCEELIGGSVWGQEQEDEEIRELLDLFAEYKEFRVEQDDQIEKEHLREEAREITTK
jgi:hypothetical protein